jgi:hypothetical protein
MTLRALQRRFKCTIALMDTAKRDASLRRVRIQAKRDFDAAGAEREVKRLTGLVPLLAGVAVPQAVLDRCVCLSGVRSCVFVWLALVCVVLDGVWTGSVCAPMLTRVVSADRCACVLLHVPHMCPLVWSMAAA